MNQEKIGKFIAENRKKQNLTQQRLSEQLGVSINAVSKWERGICLMDMSLLKPLSRILDVSVIDILSGEKVKTDNMQDKYEESIESLVKLNEVRSKSFGLYGMLFIYFILLIYKAFNDICMFDIVAILSGFNAFKFAYKYKLEKSKGDLIVSVISIIFCLFMFIEYILATVK
ncbi:MAG: helix-turn-helix transcriptional regulator [Bacilli bacterium]|nr:helix-turn-helix transcriptional regulator [Bacilli bacterium]